MSIFTIGDTHLSFGSDKPMDVFPGWQDYVSKLSKNWKNLINSNDTVIIPGDISWALSLENVLPDLKFLDELPGTKIISKGNHDYWWGTMKKMDEFLMENELKTIKFMHNNAYEVEGKAICGSRGWFFDDDSDEAEKKKNRKCEKIKFSINETKKLGLPIVVFLHYPPISREKLCEPIMNVLKNEGIETCFYAHLHGNSIAYAVQGIYDGIDFKLVSADSLNFCPLKIY